MGEFLLVMYLIGYGAGLNPAYSFILNDMLETENGWKLKENWKVNKLSELGIIPIILVLIFTVTMPILWPAIVSFYLLGKLIQISKV